MPAPVFAGGLPIGAAALAQLMPMHALVLPDGRIASVGPTLAKLCGGRLRPGSGFTDHFVVLRPAGLSDATGLDRGGPMRLTLALRQPPCTALRGLSVPLLGAAGWLLNLSLGISAVEAARQHGLTNADFAPTDLTVELLYLTEANAAVTGELAALNSRLRNAHRLAERQSLTDALTGLGNRRALDRVLARLLRGTEPLHRGAAAPTVGNGGQGVAAGEGPAAGAAASGATVPAGPAARRTATVRPLPPRPGGDRAAAAPPPAARPDGAGFALLHIDLDFFKSVNDTHGHAAGDAVLRQVARALCEETRPTDTVTRVGGDEFVLILPGVCEPAQILRLARRIIARMERPVPFEGRDCRISGSIGAVLSCAYPRPDPARLLADADAALYESKRGGRGRVTLGGPGQGAAVGGGALPAGGEG